MHHAKSFSQNCFATFTFNEENLAGRKSVNVRDFQLFMKRFRLKLSLEGRPPVEYFHSTEYGEKKQRPHHHAILFNYFPPDAEVYKNVNGNIYYKSAELSDLWDHQGFIVVGELNYKTAAYTAAYTFKKQKGKDYPDGVSPEKMTCSHAIGISHFLKYYKEYCSLGHIIYDGKKFRIPRRYLKKLNVDEKDIVKAFHGGDHPLAYELLERKITYDDLKLTRELNSFEDSILDREKKYRYLLENQKRYKKKLYNDSALSEDNKYLKQLLSLQAQIMSISGEYNPKKQEYIYESFRNL